MAMALRTQSRSHHPARNHPVSAKIRPDLVDVPTGMSPQPERILPRNWTPSSWKGDRDGVLKHKAALLFGALVLTVMAPLLRGGHILTLDMAFGPHIPQPQTITSSYLFRWLLYGLNQLLPSDIIEKVLLCSIIFLSSYGMFCLVRFLTARTQLMAAYVSGLAYAINPYTYSRFMAGQYSVLLGYALIPFFCKALLELIDTPSTKKALWLAGWITVIGIVSIHTLGLIAIVTVVGCGLAAKRYNSQKQHRKKVAQSMALTASVVVIASSYWLLPLLFSRGSTAQTIRSFSSSDTAAFATAGDSSVGKFANIIRLQGFWAEARGLYLLPQDQLPAWGLVALLVWVLVYLGARSLWRSKHRFILLVFGISALVGVILGMGLVAVPGYREPHKFVGLVALFYALCLGQGVGLLAHRYQKRSEWVGTAIPAACVVLLVAFTPTMFWGFGGQLQPRSYPPDWFAINNRLSEDHDKFQTLFLPWHLYMHFTFAGRIIANPAQDFFDKPMLVSNDPEFGGAARTSQDPLKDQLSHEILPAATDRADLGAQLARLRIKYVVFAKESDAPDYDYLNHQNDLSLVQETEHLKLYRNEAWKD
jgi:hypothetical protein